MKFAFGDTCFFQALCDPHDDLHEKAKSVYDELSGARIFTSELVIVELLNAMAGFGSHLRMFTVSYVESLRSRSDVEIVAFNNNRLTQAHDYYKRMHDKDWGITDCDAILICKQQGIEDVLTYDRHFEQASLRALLRAT